MDFEFETTRTCLANAFAAAGAELLVYQPLVSAAVAAIPDTKPEKYAIAGTLPGILHMAGKMMGEEGGTGLEGLTRYDDQSGACLRDPDGEYVKFSDVERLLAARAAEPVAWQSDLKKGSDAKIVMMSAFAHCPSDLPHPQKMAWIGDFFLKHYDAIPPFSAAEKPTGDLTDEQIDELAVAYGVESREFPPDFAIKFARAAIAAHLTHQPDAEQPIDELRKSLQTIAHWELPATDKTWDDGLPMSYGACYGSNGERDYMRQIALDALAKLDATHLARQSQQAPAEPKQVQAPEKNLPGWERGIATVTLTGHQLRAALEFLNPDGDDDPDQRDESLTFGIVQHKDDDGAVSIGMCCWNDDTDGVLPLDGEYTATPASQEDAHAARNAVLEEAATICEEMYRNGEGGAGCAVACDRIRALKTPACAERSDDHE